MKSRSSPRLARLQRRGSPSSPPDSALSSTSGSPQSTSAGDPSSARHSLTSSTSTTSNSSDFVRQNPRYSSLWLQKCLLPKRLDPSTLTRDEPHYLKPECYPYPNMSDSVGKCFPDPLQAPQLYRVFVHALNTVKRIPRTGSARPPESDRLKLYGLYKQSTEGNVEGVMARPQGSSKEVVGEREKWDAWESCKGLSRTEAKRQYISTLITTMHKYATTTPEARELVGELEFVWDQIKSQSASSSGSGGSPGQGVGPMAQSGFRRRRDGSVGGGSSTRGAAGGGGAGLKVLRPMSDGDVEELNEEDEEDFQDTRTGDFVATAQGAAANLPGPARDEGMDLRNRKWRRRMEQALVKLSVEVAALREQIESRSTGIVGRNSGMLAWTRWLLSVFMKHLLVDGALILLLVVWARRKGDRRLEQGLHLFYSWVREQLLKVKIPGALKKQVKAL